MCYIMLKRRKEKKKRRKMCSRKEGCDYLFDQKEGEKINIIKTGKETTYLEEPRPGGVWWCAKYAKNKNLPPCTLPLSPHDQHLLSSLWNITTHTWPCINLFTTFLCGRGNYNMNCHIIVFFKAVLVDWEAHYLAVLFVCIVRWCRGNTFKTERKKIIFHRFSCNLGTDCDGGSRSHN